MDNQTPTYTILKNFECKVEALDCSSCMLALTMMSMSLAVDARRLTKYFLMMLDGWRKCLPLGDACDVNFTTWGHNVWELMQKVRQVYSQNKVQLNVYEYNSASYLEFKNRLEAAEGNDDSMKALMMISGSEAGTILMCAMRELNEELMEISEFLNSPTEEQIASSFDQWMACYEEQYHKACLKRYNKWKLKFTPRTLRKNVKERMKIEVEEFRRMFQSDNEFELVYDTEQMEVDIEGVSRFLFTNPERFGVSHIDKRQAFSKELLKLFNFIDVWRMMQSDMQTKRKQGEKAAAPVVDELDQKVKVLLDKIRHLTADNWKQHLPKLWKSIFTTFRTEISNAGSHEKFQEFSKKTLYCIIGHLKQKGAYKQISNLELTMTLEGMNNGMRKYLNSGLVELEQSLRERIESFVDQEMQRLVAVE
ncbi:MAG: hypothetical protein IJ886_08600 [Prevotella sp.]|nr:hypothetical protein [Prevotella sp.]